MKFYSGFLIGLQLIDVFFTKIGLMLGSFHEGNPFGQWLLNSGISGLLIAKLIATIIVLTLLWSLRPYHGKLANNLLVYSCFLMTLVVFYNGYLLLKVL